MGVDGFRFDAAKYIYYNDPEKSVDFWNWYMAELRKIKPDIYTVAEVWDADGATFPYFQSTNCFNFSMSQSSGKIASTAKGGNVNTFVNYIAGYLENIHAQNPNAMLVSFIANHDTDRAAGFLTTAGGYAYMAANLNILLPGSSFIYYGEEIGMLGSRGGANTDANRRLAMLWGDDDMIRDPVGSTYPEKNQISTTVADQMVDENSMYNYYCRLLAVRHKYPAFARGMYTAISCGSKNLGGFAIEYEGEMLGLIHNTSTEELTFDLSGLDGISFTELCDAIGMGNAVLEGTILTVGPQTSVILE
jgi:glycosidase